MPLCPTVGTEDTSEPQVFMFAEQTLHQLSPLPTPIHPKVLKRQIEKGKRGTFLFWTETHHFVLWVGLELTEISFLLYPECWGYRRVPLYLSWHTFKNEKTDG